jgi:hypothetical protein
LVDAAMMEGLTPDEQRWLDAHLAECEDCARHAELSQRAVAALSGFAFEVDSQKALRVQETVRVRAEQLAASPAGRLRAWALPLALALTAAGSAVMWQAASALAARWGVPAAAWHAAWVACWVLPSAIVDGLLLVRGRLDGSSNEGDWQ